MTTSYVYDGAGRLETVTTGEQTTTFAYDAAGNRASVANPNLGATLTAGDAMVSVKFKYNGHGELTEREDARGATHYGYDKIGRRTCAADRDFAMRLVPSSRVQTSVSEPPICHEKTPTQPVGVFSSTGEESPRHLGHGSLSDQLAWRYASADGANVYTSLRVSGRGRSPG